MAAEAPSGTLCTVFFCPNGEPSGNCADQTKVRLAKETTFGDVHHAVSMYYSQNPMTWVLRNEENSIWPPGKGVIDELRLGGTIRLTRMQDDVEEEEAKVEEEEEDDAAEEEIRTGARQAKPSELLAHFIFLTILMVDTYIGSNIEARYFVHSALQSAFIEPRSIYKEASGGKITAFHRAEGFAKISTTAHMCDWVKFRLPHGLFHTDQRVSRRDRGKHRSAPSSPEPVNTAYYRHHLHQLHRLHHLLSPSHSQPSPPPPPPPPPPSATRAFTSALRLTAPAPLPFPPRPGRLGLCRHLQPRRRRHCHQRKISGLAE